MRPLNFQNPCIFLLLGPISLAICYIFLIINDLNHYRGFFSYFSATIGDVFFLTIVVCYMFEYLNNQSYLREMNWKPILIWSLGISILITVAIHFMWIINPNTENNWTIVNGSLNIYGVLHGIYFILMLSCILFGFYCIFTILSKKDLKQEKNKIFQQHFEYFIVILQAIIMYCLLLYIDNNRVISFNLFYSPVGLSIYLFIFVCSYYIYLYRRLNSLEKISNFIFSIVLTILLVFFSFFLICVINTGKEFSPVIQFFVYLFFPLICFQNYIYNIFRIHKREISPIFFMSALAIYLSISSITAASALIVLNSPLEEIGYSFIVAEGILLLGGLFIFFFVLFIISIHDKKEDLTPMSGHWNLAVNYLGFLVMMSILLVGIIVTSEEAKNLLFSKAELVTYTGTIISFLWAISIIVIKGNDNHLKEWNNNNYGTKAKNDVIIHLWVSIISYLAFNIIISAWLISKNIISL